MNNSGSVAVGPDIKVMMSEGEAMRGVLTDAGLWADVSAEIDQLWRTGMPFNEYIRRSHQLMQRRCKQNKLNYSKRVKVAGVMHGGAVSNKHLRKTGGQKND